MIAIQILQEHQNYFSLGGGGKSILLRFWTFRRRLIKVGSTWKVAHFCFQVVWREDQIQSLVQGHFLMPVEDVFRPGKSLGGERIPRQFLGRFVLTFKNRGRRGDSFLRNYVLGTLRNVWPLMGPQNGEPALRPVAPVQVGRLTQKKVPSASTRSPRRSSGLIEDLVHQDAGGLTEGFSP